MVQQFRKIAAVGFVFLMGTSAIFAQKYSHKRLEKRQEILLYFGGGLSPLQYSATTGKQSGGLGGQMGFNCNVFLSRKFSLKTGVEFSTYSSSFSLEKSSIRFMTTDIENTLFEFRSTMENYKEKQYIIMLQVPFMVQFQSGRKHQFYAALGGKIGLPLIVKYNNSSTSIQNTGYYAEEDYEYTTQQFMGFGKFPGSSGDLKFKIAFFGSAEIGGKWIMRDGYKLYTGVYVDYGLNNIANQQVGVPFVEYNMKNPSDFVIHSIFESQYSQGNEMRAFTNKIVPLAAGIRVTMAF
ncbi:MAG: outer membrane beta-barrel protein [Lentimicrobiaceae bacterium]|nr:outer membrane beta-barrel protein [Lentimicrobiaceae bacterium]